MEISGSYTLYASRARVWDALVDADSLRDAIPGCELLDQLDGDTYALRVAVGVAAFTGTYEGTLRLMERRAPERFRVAIQGTGASGMLQGYGGVTLEARGPTTTVVTYTGEALLGGSIASAGLFVIRGAARVLINRFFSRLAGALAEEAPEVAPRRDEPAAPTADQWPAIGIPEARPLEIAAQGTPEARPLPPGAPAVVVPRFRARPSARAPRRPLLPRLTAPAALRRMARRAGLSNGSTESEQRAAIGLLGVVIGLAVTLAASLAVVLGGRRRGS
ncbi:MAG TPA: carbon monoxide dehydrogenase subunit G [Ktedonobacterales bacterium]|nr:carbon monoxide dehydrogenase subunit G [Ktedonobacterales bacterium]